MLTLGIGAALVLVGAPRQSPASASAPHRAAVVVDLGDGRVKVGCVSFTEDHISGLEALDRASMAPVAQTFSGQGGAVCALCGKGCAAGSSCLTCKAPNYWAYYHRGAYSGIGSSQSQVRDGDTEGWKWGKGEAPAKVAFAKVCSATGPPPSAASTTTTAVTRPSATAPDTTRPAFVPGPPSPGITPPGQGPTSAPLTTGVPTTSPTPRLPGSPTTAPGQSTSTLPPTTLPAGQAPSTLSRPPDTAAEKKSSKRPSSQPAESGSKDAEIASADGPKRVVVKRTGGERRSATNPATSGDASPLLSIAGFVAAIGLVGGLLLVLRRRRGSAG